MKAILSSCHQCVCPDQNDIIDLLLRGFHHRCFELLIVLSVSELHFSVMYFVCFVHDDRCCPFVFFFEVYGRVVSVLTLLKATISLRNKFCLFCLGFVILMTASCVLTLSK